MGKIHHIAKELILRHRKEHLFRLDSHQLSDRHESTCLVPSMIPIHKHNGFDPRFPLFPLPGCLTHEQIHQVSRLHLDEIPTLTAFQKSSKLDVYAEPAWNQLCKHSRVSSSNISHQKKAAPTFSNYKFSSCL